MKLLSDQNLSHKLVARLACHFTGSIHVRELGMTAADDHAIWQHARIGGFAIVSKDGDFHQLSLLHGAPPKVIWLRVGNASTDEVACLMQLHFDAMDAFIGGTGSLLVIDP